MLISKPGFVKWITDKYLIFRNPLIRLPWLNYLIMRHKVFLKHLLLKKFNILSPKIDYYPKHDVFNIVNLHPLIYPVVAGDRLEKDKILDSTSLDEGSVVSSDHFFPPEVHLINKQIFSDNQILSENTSERDETLEETYLDKNPAMSGGPFSRPETYFSKYILNFPIINKQKFSDNQISSEYTLEKDEVLEETSLDEGPVRPGGLLSPPETYFSKYILNSPIITKQVFSNSQMTSENNSKKDKIPENNSINKNKVRPSNILSYPEIYFSKYVLNSSLINKQIFLNNKRVTYSSNKNSPLKDGNKPIPAPVNQTERFFPGSYFIGRKPDIVKKPYPIMPFKNEPKESTKYTFKKGAVPTLHYITPLRVSLNDLRKTVEVIEKRVAESKNLNGKIDSRNSSLENKMSNITNKENITVSHLTEQVYQMLERKIRIERERKGLY